MTNPFMFVFSADVQTEREVLQQTLHEAVSKGDLQTVKATQEALCAWLQTHPDDYVMWDAGEPLAMLTDALEIETVQPKRAHAV